MTKRHKHVKPSGKKKVGKAHKKRGPRHTEKTRSVKGTRRPKKKPLSKGTRLHKGKTPRKVRTNRATQKGVKGKGNNTAKPRRAKASRSNKNKVRGSYVERLKRKKQLEREIKERQEILENISVEETKSERQFSNRKKPINAKRYIQKKEGVKLKEKKIDGFRYVYSFQFPEGSFEQKVRYANQVDLSFLYHALGRNFKQPRAVYINLESRTKDGRRRDFKSVSPIDFVVNLLNIKKFLLQCMIEWQDRFATGMLDGGEQYAQDYDVYSPDYLYRVSFQFIY